MRTALALLLIASSTSLGAAPADTPRSSPLLGTWAVDVSRLPVPPQARPKSVTIEFGESPAGKWTTQVDILGGDGSKRHIASTYVPDGTPASIEGDTVEADTAAVKLPAANVMVLALGKGGIPASTRIYTVSPNGAEMTETAVYFGADGKPIMRTNYFTRIH
jgi:hypothetical protein